ncbi:aminotransferase class I/II-fold pyridoxal phosphate-dependent enzyme [Paractinoplanes hotanensis]|uniref:Aminotransferase n=1 Tax=Paractinoplanes hotanensis TaxID=2906497 RepID=A0ABT0YAQ5_9ACTN|nr:aminotransferase class I/II-fold pyridoxal phosphate-dependent enzyme [Actinoplanes hotanensis]MCM4083125.1 aminotransferase class I/II-fold pyridoxal phosphate-dependent enzyme [Actinoplanes hotanensis]
MTATSAGAGQTSVFTLMTRLAAEHGAVNLAQGFPDFDPPLALLLAAEQALDGGHQYSASAGLPLLRRAIAADREQRLGTAVDPDDEVTITAGATEALYCTARALLGPGSEAIVLEPFYEQYPPCVAAAQGTIRYVTSRFPDFAVDLDELARAFTPRTRLVFLNTPWNPAGRLLGEAELRRIGELAAEHGAWLVADETYEHITFGGARHIPVASVDTCRDRTITISSVSKTFSATGWRVGWAVAPAPVTALIRGVKQFVTFAPATPLQAAAAEMIASMPTGYYDRLRAQYSQRRAVLADYLARLPLELAPHNGTYFLTARAGRDDVDYCGELIRRSGVAAIPASRFYHDPAAGRGLVRFAFCKRLDTLRLAGDRLTTEEIP